MINHESLASPRFNTGCFSEQKPIISVKTKLTAKADAVDQQQQREVWSFLTLGVPALLQMFSLFCSAITHREKTGVPLRVRFKSHHLPLEKVNQLAKFHQFNQVSPLPLNEVEKNKALQLAYRLVNEAENARGEGDLSKYAESQKKLRHLVALLEKNKTAYKSRKDFDEGNWATIDLIDFELTREYFEELTGLFNAEWMTSSKLKQTIKTDFDIDYCEAVVAESLSLALAYIEGIDGKMITLPVFDEAEGKYRSATYTISKTRLGDALPCYILESGDPLASPWFVIRGTQYYTGLSPQGKEYRQGSLESILADSIDAKCISRHVINKALVSRPIVKLDGRYEQRESLSDVFRHWKRQGKRVNICGHSLGATLANALTVEFYDQVKTAYGFSGAGVSKKTADRWEEIKKERSQEANKKIVNFDYEGDMIPSGGRFLIGDHFAVESVKPKESGGIYNAHVRSHLNQDFQIQKVNVFRENRKFARLFCERLRIITGKCFQFLLNLFRSKDLPDWWKNRKVYREYASAERQLRPVI